MIPTKEIVRDALRNLAHFARERARDFEGHDAQFQHHLAEVQAMGVQISEQQALYADDPALHRPVPSAAAARELEMPRLSTPMAIGSMVAPNGEQFDITASSVAADRPMPPTAPPERRQQQPENPLRAMAEAALRQQEELRQAAAEIDQKRNEVPVYTEADLEAFPSKHAAAEARVEEAEGDHEQERERLQRAEDSLGKAERDLAALTAKKADEQAATAAEIARASAAGEAPKVGEPEVSDARLEHQRFVVESLKVIVRDLTAPVAEAQARLDECRVAVRDLIDHERHVRLMLRARPLVAALRSLAKELSRGDKERIGRTLRDAFI